MVRDRPYRNSGDVYYVNEPGTDEVVYETGRSRGPAIRSVPSTQYLYADGRPASVHTRGINGSGGAFVDGDRPVQFVDEYMYVDDNGNQVELPGGPNPVTYNDYDDDYRRRPRRSKYPSSTRVIYE